MYLHVVMELKVFSLKCVFADDFSELVLSDCLTQNLVPFHAGSLVILLNHRTLKSFLSKDTLSVISTLSRSLDDICTFYKSKSHCD